MQTKGPTNDILKQFALLEKKAAKQVHSAKAAIDKKISKEVAAIHKKYSQQLKQLEGILARFGVTSAPAPKVKAAQDSKGGKRTRRTLPKTTDEEIKSKLSTILAGSKKVSSAVVFKEVGLARPRFTAFLKANTGFITVEGDGTSFI